MMKTFDLSEFTPYLLAQAAESASLGFQQYYKSQYGMLRTEWRVLFHLGRYGQMTAKEICDRARIHKTKVSRAVSALEDKRYLQRQEMQTDRRHSTLFLTLQGRAVYDDLAVEAQKFDDKIMSGWSDEAQASLRGYLREIANF